MNRNKQFLALLTPSWVSTMIGIVAGVLLAAGVIVLDQYQGSQLRQEIFEVHANAGPQTQHVAFHNVTTNIANNHILGTAPLFIIWACVGLVVYYLTIAIARMFGTAFELKQQLDYVNVSRQALLKEALLQFGIRIVACLAWFGFIKLTLAVIVPYALAAANSGAQSFSVTNALYVLLAVLVIVVDVYIQAIFLRLIALKPRVFGN